MSGEILDSLYVETIGKGTPLLVMHGGLGWDHTYFRPWMDRLGEGCEVIYYDHRGNGRSARPPSWDAIDHASWVEDAEELREALGHDRIVLFGHSYGAFLSMEYALRFPERVRGLILCNAAPSMAHGELAFSNAAARGTPEQLALLSEAFSSPIPDDDEMERITSAIASLYLHRPSEELVASVFGEVRCSAEAFNRAFFGCVPSLQLSGKLGALEMPVLLLGGEDDWIMPPSAGIDLIYSEIPHAKRFVFEESGHFPFAEEPDHFRATVLEWMAGL